MEHLKIKALIVDDLDYIRNSITGILNDIGIEDTQEACDGEDAMEKIILEHEGGTPFQVILCDVHMPNCDGLSLLEQVRSDRRFKKLPVLMVSSESDVSMIKKVIASGANNYLLKPFTPETLESKIQTVLGLEQVGETAL